MAKIRAFGRQRVCFVEEEYAGRIAPGSIECVVQIRLCLPGIRSQDLIDSDADETGVDLTGGGTRKMCLAAAGRAVHEDAAAYLLAVGFEGLCVRERVDDFDFD